MSLMSEVAISWKLTGNAVKRQDGPIENKNL